MKEMLNVNRKDKMLNLILTKSYLKKLQLVKINFIDKTS